jgi:hypothetical protein
MYSAQIVQVKGDINLESVQVYPGSGSMGFPPTMGGNMGFPSTMGGNMGFPSTMGGNMGFPSAMGGDMGYCPPPPQPSYGGDFNAGFGFPSAPQNMAPPPFAVCILYLSSLL